MRWLIVEDALRDRKGHWLEWVTTFDRGLRELGDEVSVLADSEVHADIRESLRAEPVLPHSIWHRLGDGAGPLTRYRRVFTHNWKTARAVTRYLRTQPDFDAIFVPTVSVHHLWAWTRLIKGALRQRKTRILLFFLVVPARADSVGNVIWEGSPTARLLHSLLQWLAPEVRSGKVVLGVETKAMQQACEQRTGIPFTWFPQPVAPPVCNTRTRDETIEMACFGAARAEKGSDILQSAIKLHLHQFPNSRAHFTVQWIDDFQVGGRHVAKCPSLLNDPNVRFLTHYFGDDEYPERLAQTDVILLPYRISSYALRGSRVVVEAAVNGLPVVVTRGTTLAAIAEDFGTGILCNDGDAQSVADAIVEMEARFNEMTHRAVAAKAAATGLFSIKEFRRIFTASGARALPQSARPAPSSSSARLVNPGYSHEP